MVFVYFWVVSVIFVIWEIVVVNIVSISILDRECKIFVIFNKYKKINMWFYDVDDFDFYF